MKRICLGCCLGLLVFSLHAGERATSHPAEAADPSLLRVKETAVTPGSPEAPAPEVKATLVPPQKPARRALAPSWPRAEVLVLPSSPETVTSGADSLKVTPGRESRLPPDGNPKVGKTVRGGIVLAIDDEDTAPASGEERKELPPNSVELVPGWAE